MGSAPSKHVLPVEIYNEEPTPDQTYHRHRVLNQIKNRNLTVTIPENTEPMIYTPVKYNKYKKRKQ